MKILLVRMDRVGDLLVTTPAIKLARKLFPTAQIDILLNTWNASVMDGNPYIDTIHIVRKQHPFFNIGTVFKLRKERYDYALVFNGLSTSTTYFTALCKPRTMLGVYGKKTQKYYHTDIHAPLPSSITTHPFLQASNGRHEIPTMLHLVNQVAILEGKSIETILENNNVDDLLHMDFYIDSKNILYTSKEQSPHHIGLFIGNAKKQHTRWPLDNFIELAHRLLRDGTQVTIILGKGEEKLIQQNTRKFPPQCTLLNGNLTLHETASHMLDMDCVVTSSTSIMHICGALDIPTVSVLGPYTFTFWRCLGSMHTYVVGKGNIKSNDVRDISVERVYTTLLEHLKRYHHNTL